MARLIRDFFLAAAAVALPIIGLVDLLIPRQSVASPPGEPSVIGRLIAPRCSLGAGLFLDQHQPHTRLRLDQTAQVALGHALADARGDEDLLLGRIVG